MTNTTCFSFTLLSFVQACWVLAYTELLYLPGLLHNVQNDQRGMELEHFNLKDEAHSESTRTASPSWSNFSRDELGRVIEVTFEIGVYQLF